MSETAENLILNVNTDENSVGATLRKRMPWNSIVSDGIDLLADVDELDDEEEEDIGCPLPSTPEDNQLLEAEVFNSKQIEMNKIKRIKNFMDYFVQ